MPEPQAVAHPAYQCRRRCGRAARPPVPPPRPAFRHKERRKLATERARLARTGVRRRERHVPLPRLRPVSQPLVRERAQAQLPHWPQVAQQVSARALGGPVPDAEPVAERRALPKLPDQPQPGAPPKPRSVWHLSQPLRPAPVETSCVGRPRTEHCVRQPQWHCRARHSAHDKRGTSGSCARFLSTGGTLRKRIRMPNRACQDARTVQHHETAAMGRMNGGRRGRGAIFRRGCGRIKDGRWRGDLGSPRW